MRLNKNFIASIMLVMVPGLIFLIITMLQNKYEKLPVYDSSLNTNKEDKTLHFIQPFNLINQYGKNFSDKDLCNKIYVADFFFTSCLSSCPKMTGNLKLVENIFKS